MRTIASLGDSEVHMLVVFVDYLTALFCSEELAQGGAGVRVQVETTGSVTLLWRGTQAVLTSAGAVSTQELQPIVVHSVESMHASRRALLGEQQLLVLS